MAREKPFYHRPVFAWMLNLLLPGLGHIFWYEYLFGLFVFLIMLIAIVLVLFSYLFKLPPAVAAILYGLPIIFYSFVFVDLSRTIRRFEANGKTLRSGKTAAMLVTLGLLVQLALPLAPINFFLRNHPGVIGSSDDSMAPLIDEGSFCLVDHQAYTVELFFLKGRHPHTPIERWQPVQFKDPMGTVRTGLVLGLPLEEVALVNDSLFVDGFPIDDPAAVPLSGELSLTPVGSYSILAVTLHKGVVDRPYVVGMENVIGRVHRLF